jgi:DNA (cytosine-5)-methyltransferase 1
VNFTRLEKEKELCLDIWQEFLDRIPINDKLPSFPIWAMEFGATYPFEESTPYSCSSQRLGQYKGNFGVSLLGMKREEKFRNLPNYAKTEQTVFPRWKRNYIRSNRQFYEKYKNELKLVVKKIKELPIASWQKFEWNIQGGERIIRNYIVQFRGSGIRLKKPDFFPSLVCVSTQIPIIGWQDRYITKWEGARLQGMGTLNTLPENNGAAFDALGNAVNAEVVHRIAEKLLQTPVKEKKISPKKVPPVGYYL